MDGVNNLFPLFGAVILIAWTAKKIMDERTLETFDENFLKLENKERERLLKKYIKSKNNKEQETAMDVFVEHFKDISKEIREEIIEYLLNIEAIKKPSQKETQKEIVIRDLVDIVDRYFHDIPPSLRNHILLKIIEAKDFHSIETPHRYFDIMDKYFHDIPPSLRNHILLKIIEAKDFGIAKVIKNHLKEIPVEILNKAFIELSNTEMMEILYEYDRSTCIDEGVKEEALRRYVKRKWMDTDVKILKKFLERGIHDKKLEKDILTLLSLKERGF